jgi:hypothetical protein
MYEEGIRMQGGYMKVCIDRDTLVDLYINKDLKSQQVAEELGVCDMTVRKYLHKYGLHIKGRKHYKTLPRVEYTVEQFEFFDGLMLGDGSLVRRKIKCSTGLSNAKISCAFKYIEFARYIDKILCMGGSIHKKVVKNPRYKNGVNIAYGLYSSDNILFTEERKRWYPNNKKIIPADFRFSPTSMNIEYLCDGHLTQNEAIILSTQSFERQNTENIIINKLSGIGVESWLTKHDEVYIPKRSSHVFLEYIGASPVKCYSYKWSP